MKVLFCEQTGDITYKLSKKQAEELKRDDYSVPILMAECKNFSFYLMNSARIKETSSGSDIQIIEPRSKDYLRYTTKIGDWAYQELLDRGMIGTRYGNSSKLTIMIDEEL